jgi:diacylglycerol kinase (ATP)
MFVLGSAAKMRAAAILGLGSSTRNLKPFQQDSQVQWVIGLPAERAGIDAILVFGGDGTVHRHLGALVKLGLPVLVVPAGSGNDFARAIGLFSVRDSASAWQRFAATRGNVRVVDLGVITPIAVRASYQGTPSDVPQQNPLQPPLQPMSSPERVARSAAVPFNSLDRKEASGAAVYFSCAAGVGLDGEIARRANSLPRWLRAHGGYALSLPAALVRFRSFDLKLSVAKGEPAQFCLRTQQPVVAAVFANTPVYGGGMRVAPRAKMDDGLLDVCVIHDISKLKLLSVFPSVYLGRHLGISEVDYFPSAKVRVETDRPLDVYADGEYVCPTPVEVGVANSALRVIVPG